MKNTEFDYINNLQKYTNSRTIFKNTKNIKWANSKNPSKNLPNRWRAAKRKNSYQRTNAKKTKTMTMTKRLTISTRTITAYKMHTVSSTSKSCWQWAHKSNLKQSRTSFQKYRPNHNKTSNISKHYFCWRGYKI